MPGCASGVTLTFTGNAATQVQMQLNTDFDLAAGTRALAIKARIKIFREEFAMRRRGHVVVPCGHPSQIKI